MSKLIRNPEAYRASYAAKAEAYDRRINQIITQIGTYIAQNHYVLHGENEQRVISELYAEGVLGQRERGTTRSEFSRNRDYKTFSKEALVREALRIAVETGSVLRYDDKASGEVMLSLPIDEEDASESEHTPPFTEMPDMDDAPEDLSSAVFRHLKKRTILKNLES